jgi:hypothetical protein
MISERAMADAKRSILQACNGPRARYPIDSSTVEAILDDFIREAIEKSKRSIKAVPPKSACTR